MTKQEALKKIAELRQYIEDQDKPLRVEAGDIFRRIDDVDGSISEVVLIENYQGGFLFAGNARGSTRMKCAFSTLYSDFGKTKEQLRVYLKEAGYYKVGKMLPSYGKDL